MAEHGVGFVELFAAVADVFDGDAGDLGEFFHAGVVFGGELWSGGID